MRGADRVLFGGDYNPEQWPESVWHDDVRLMAAAGVNTVTLGVFSWSSIEPREGEYDFGWLDRVIDLMHVNGIGVVLATPTASPPPWFTRAHPEALNRTADGVQLVHGSRDVYDPSAEAYREAARRVATALGERYGRHEAVVAWHVHNEYGSVSYGPATDRRFRDWLQAKYGDLGRLNDAWWSAFWSQRYAQWDEILAPQATQYLPNPSQMLDFRRFSAEVLLECYREQARILRGLSPDVPLTTNFMLPTWLHFDHWAFGAEVDFVSIDHYSDSPGVEGAAHAAFGADQARSFARGRPWLLMEQGANVTQVPGRMLVKEPGEVIRTSLQHVARGSDGALFFQWRAPLAGAEVFHSSMVPQRRRQPGVPRDDRARPGAGAADRRGRASPGAAGRVVTPRVAIAWEPDSWWAVESVSLPSDHFSLLAVRRAHRELWFAGVSADLVRLDDDPAELAAYDLLLVPSQLLATDEQAAGLDAWVQRGGHAVVWCFSGTVDADLHVRPGGYSGAFAETLGIRVEEPHPLPKGARVAIEGGGSAHDWTEHVELRGASVVTRYAEGVLAGEPAITEHRRGEGLATYVSAELDDASFTALVASALAAAGVEAEAPGAGGGMEVVRRHTATGTVVVAINHTAESRTVALAGTSLLGAGEALEGGIPVPPGAFVVLREPPLPA
nr:beta-galactosidase [Microbacterium flavescens]